MVYRKQDWGNESEEERIDRESAETDFTYEVLKDSDIFEQIKKQKNKRVKRIKLFIGGGY